MGSVQVFDGRYGVVVVIDTVELDEDGSAVTAAGAGAARLNFPRPVAVGSGEPGRNS